MAATATATPRVAEEIAARLGLRDWVSIRSGFDRPNLAFDVVSVEGKGAVARKRAALLHVLERSGGAAGDRVLRHAQGHRRGGGDDRRDRASRRWPTTPA
jgi:superfamily II DNA helicase RecQ